MNRENDSMSGTAKRRKLKQQDVKIIRRQGQRRRYISQHFNPAKLVAKSDDDVSSGVKVKCDDSIDRLKRTSSLDDIADFTDPRARSATPTPPIECPRVFFGLKVDDLSSDSELSDVPDDLGSDPFFSDDEAPPPTVIRAAAAAISLKEGRKKEKKTREKKREDDCKTSVKSRASTKRTLIISPYFPTAKHAHRSHFLATLPFPPLTHTCFGLMQERLAHDPFRLLLATIFLNKTPGIRAMPIFYNLMGRYPSPEALANADVTEVTSIIHELGFQNQRARKCIELAKTWVRCPPAQGQRFRKLHYPVKGDGKDVKEDETIDDVDPRVAWEISHLPGLGPYSHDSWRMFCRDELRRKASDWLGTDACEFDFEPEWKRVLPMDKELRAWMTWMWLKEGWIWNKENGEKTKADDELIRLARGGGVVQESAEQQYLIVRGTNDSETSSELQVERPAGTFMPAA